jgi:FolB domain-containing protein
VSGAESEGLRALLDSIGPDPAADDLVANDLEFHRRIAACAGNSVLASLLESLSVPTTRARVWRRLTQTGARARTLAEHRGHPRRAGRAPARGGQVLVDGAHRRRRAVAGLGTVSRRTGAPHRGPARLRTVSGMDIVSVRDLSVRAVIGVHEWERAIEQTLVFNVDMAADVRTPATSDDLADALDYSAVAATIAAVVREGKFRLIETAAERVADRLLTTHGLIWLRLEVRKPILDAYTAVIIIERTS